MRRAAKVDANHGDIVAALRKVGASVQSLAAIGHGCPDLLVCYPAFRDGIPVGSTEARLHLLEVKDGAKVPSARGLTGDQIEWIRRWGGPVYVVLSPADALRVIGAAQ